jgi:hypothetical protein
MVVVTWLTESSVNDPTCWTVVWTRLDVASWVVPAASEYVAEAWLPMTVLAGGAAASAVELPNRKPSVKAAAPAHDAGGLRPMLRRVGRVEITWFLLGCLKKVRNRKRPGCRVSLLENAVAGLHSKESG